MKTLNNARNKKAFTLVELLIVLFMLGLVMTSIYSLYLVHQRSAYTQDDVADVQQNLHVAMDTLAKEIHLSGFVMSFERQDPGSLERMTPIAENQNNNNSQSIRATFDLSGNYAGLLPLTDDAFSTQPQRIHADRLDLNFGTNLSSCATVNLGNLPPPLNEGRPFSDLAGVFPVSRVEDLDPFSATAPGTQVRIIRPSRHNQVTNLRDEIPDPFGPGTCFRVNALNPLANPPSMTLTVDNSCPGNIPPTADIKFRSGDQICPQSNGVYPYRITYCLGPDNLGQCPVPGGTICNQGANDQTLCLMRIENFGTPFQAAQVLATRISGLQFSYLLDDGSEVPNNVTPIGGGFSRLNEIRAVRVTITGQTVRARELEGVQQEKTRSQTTIIKLRDRFTWL